MLAVYTQHISKKDLKQYLDNWTEIEVRFHMVDSFLRYLGLILSLFYCFICCKEALYQWPKILKKIPYGKTLLKITPWFSILVSTIFCIIISFIFFLLGLWSQNWLLYNILATFCCIGAIKMFRFTSLKNATFTMTIIIVTMILLMIWSQIKL